MAELMLIPFVTFRLMVYNTSHYCYLKLETTKNKHSLLKIGCSETPLGHYALLVIKSL